MAKINLTTQHSQEGNLSTVASLGVLFCIVITIVGIKLWGFKHRLSFDEATTQKSAGAAGTSTTPTVIVPGKSKQLKHKRNRRHSEQSYKSVEVHGVFRQKSEDDLEIQRPQTLPPVRIRRLSEGLTCVMLSPPRNRPKVHSMAFEDLEIAVPPLAPASSSDLSAISENDMKISLTFEELESQFKLKEMKANVSEPENAEGEIMEIPVPPLRLNRSTSAMNRSEKSQRGLKSSQSITIPEYHKVQEKMPNHDFSKPTEDLTKCDDYDEPKKFELFGERRPTGYIKYEEVDSDLIEEYEKELNEEADNGEVSGIMITDPKALRNQYTIYNNDSNESSGDGHDGGEFFREFRFNRKEDCVIKELPDPISISTESVTNVKVEDTRSSPLYEKEFQNLAENTQRSLNAIKVSQNSKLEERDQGINLDSNIVKSFSLQEHNDNQFEVWPQFEENIETPKVNVRRFTYQDSQDSYKETEDNCSSPIIEAPPDDDEKFPFNQRKLKDNIATDFPECLDITDMEECQNDFDKKCCGQVRSFITTESCPKSEQYVVTFDSLSLEDLETEDHYQDSALKQRRPTGFVRRQEEYYESYELSDDSDEENKSDGNHSVEIVEIETEVNYEDNDTDKFKISQGQPTECVGKTLDNDYSYSVSNSSGDSKDYSESKSSKTHNKFAKGATKKRRLMGFTRNTGIFDASEDLENLDLSNQQDYEKTIYDLEDEEILPLNSQSERVTEEDHSFNEIAKNTESLLKQRSPTGFLCEEEVVQPKKEVNFELNNESENESIFSQENEAIKHRRPTGFIRREEVSKNASFYLNQNSDEEDKTEFGNELLRHRRPTGFVRKNKHQPPNDDTFNNDDSDFDEHLWQEMQNNVEQGNSSNFEVEFDKIRHSYELNEADFLEAKPTPAGFGKTIEDDWDNFEKLKATPKTNSTLSDKDLLGDNTSILKDYIKDEDVQPKPRKSKVTFDIKIDERVIPARNSPSLSEEDSDIQDNAYDRPFPSIPPRMANINYKNETSPIVPLPMALQTEDSWSAIHRHRNLTEEFQNLSTNSKPSPAAELAVDVPPKASYRNPMAQLAIQRAKEVRADFNSYKSRSITNKKPENAKKPKQNLNFSNDDNSATEA